MNDYDDGGGIGGDQGLNNYERVKVLDARCPNLREQVTKLRTEVRTNKQSLSFSLSRRRRPTSSTSREDRITKSLILKKRKKKRI